MSKIIFDVLSKELDLKKEVEKLFSIEKIIKVQDDYGYKFEEITYKK